MRVRALRKIALCLLALQLIAASGVARACEPAEEGPIFGTADAIFVGRLVDYEIEYFSTGERASGLLTYEVQEVLQGQLADEVTVMWHGGPLNGELPDSVSAPENELIGVTLPGSDAHTSYWSPRVVVLPMAAMRPLLVTGGSRDRLRISATEQNIDAVRRWIETGELTRIPAYSYVTAPSVQISARTIRFWRWVGLILGVSVITLLIGSLILVLRHKNSGA